MTREIFHCLKRERDICIQTIIPSKNMAFMLTPALNALKRVKGPLIIIVIINLTLTVVVILSICFN